MKTKIYYLLIVILSLTTSCSTEEENDISSDNPNNDAIVKFSFTNDGTNPMLSVNSTTGSIQIEQNSTLTSSQSRYIFTFSGVTFFENSDVFAIKNIIPQAKEESGKWGEDYENQFSLTNSKSLDIILVLDVSSSLGININNVKNSAIQMIQQILNENPDARIGVIKFSEGNVAVNFNSNYSTLANFISSQAQYTSPITSETYFLESRNATGLYEAILKGVSLLETSNAKGKGIITLTDGSNNYQEDPNNDNSSVVIDALEATNIKHYTVGFIGNQGTIDEIILKNLAINGEYAPANNTNLNQVFTRFSNNIATIYDFVYQTNKSSFSGDKEFRLLIDLEKVN